MILMEKICSFNNCCGCGLCMHICPVGAIKMELNEEGFRYPLVDAEICCNCKKCIKICPANRKCDSGAESSKLMKCPVYGGYSLEHEILVGSSSGGLVSQVAREVLREGGIVFGVQYCTGYKGAEFVQIDNIEDLPKIAKSKYVETDRSNLFSQIKPALETHKKVLVVGLPCDIAAVKNYVGSPENLYTCRLVCMSTASKKAFLQYIKDKEQEFGAKLVSLDLRYKHVERPSFPTQVKLEFENGKVYQGYWIDQDLYKAFFLMNRESCYHCLYKKNIEGTDLIAGDFHGVSERASYYHPQGVSLFLPISDKGKELITQLKKFYFQEVEGNVVINYNQMFFNSYQKSYLRDEFSGDFRKFGLRYACKNLVYSQNEKLDFISHIIIRNKTRIAVWGCGDTLVNLYSRLKMEEWNIIGLFDGSELKIGRVIKGFKVQNLEKLRLYIDIADIVVTFIPSNREEALTLRLRRLGWNKEVIHVGKYKYYR